MQTFDPPYANYTSFNGGTVTLTNGALLTGSIALSNLTFNGDIETTQSYRGATVGDPSWTWLTTDHTVDLIGDVAINGHVQLGDDAGQFYGVLRFSGGPRNATGTIVNSLNGRAVIQFGSNPQNALIAILGLAVLMVVHEGGHYLAARRFGMRVTKFSIGFGPTLWKHRPKNSPTTFQVAIIPFLAYVQIAGATSSADDDLGMLDTDSTP